MQWLTVNAAAKLIGVTSRAIQMAVKRKGREGVLLLHNHPLNFRYVKGIGGNSGKSLQVALESLPQPLQQRWHDLQSTSQLALPLHSIDKTDVGFAQHVLAPILALPKHSRERGKAFEAILANPPLVAGQLMPLSARTLRRWISDYEAHGLKGLATRKRADAGKPKVHFTRAFDHAVLMAGASHETLAAIAHDALQKIRAYVSAGTPRDKIIYLMSNEVVAIARKHDVSLREAEFSISTHLVQREANYRKVAMLNKDAKAFDDRLPRIIRTGSMYSPMEVTFGDVHPLDIQVVRQSDGSIAHPRMIAWMCGATQRVTAKLKLCEANEGVKNVDVVDSFVALINESGLPGTLYVDNGKEYGFADFFTSDVMKVTNARPYSGSSKPIESFFRHFERGFASMVPGWVAGDRQKKKTQSLGKAVVPFNGNFEALSFVIAGLLDAYNNFPQRELGNRSPNQVHAEFVAKGWTPRTINPDSLVVAFSTEVTRTVRQGRVSVGGEFWTCRELQACLDSTVIVRQPKYSQTHWHRLPVLDMARNIIGFAERETAYGYIDPAGAVEASTRKTVHTQAVRDLEKDLPKVDPLADVLARSGNIVKFPLAPAPAQQAYDVDASDMARAMLDGIRETPAAKALRERSEQDRQRDVDFARMQRRLQHGKSGDDK